MRRKKEEEEEEEVGFYVYVLNVNLVGDFHRV
jgi:hypothetical protein